MGVLNVGGISVKMPHDGLMQSYSVITDLIKAGKVANVTVSSSVNPDADMAVLIHPGVEVSAVFDQRLTKEEKERFGAGMTIIAE